MKPVIAGVADTAVGRLEGVSCMALHAQAAAAALADAKLRPSDVDGVLCAYSLAEPHLMLSSVFNEYFGIAPSYSAAVQAGGATACALVMQAAALVRAGICRNVLAVCADNRLSGMGRGGAVAALAEVGHPQFERPYGMSIPAAYALVARRCLHERGVAEDVFAEQLAAIAVTQRGHARRHPNAQARDPLSMEQALSARMIADPLRLFDCCLVSDGGAAIVVSAADTADRADRAVSILGHGQMNTHEHVFAMPSLTDFGCRQSAAQAFAMAGLGPSDIDVAEIYDSFTITLLAELESIGFFPKGEAGPAILDGALELDGILPCNTHGGLLSYAHSGAAGGMFHIVEAVRQLRGEADLRQVAGAETAFVHGDGGILSAHCSLILGRA
ncbi:thiolase family protein [Azospirillum doebereinerae]